MVRDSTQANQIFRNFFDTSIYLLSFDTNCFIIIHSGTEIGGSFLSSTLVQKNVPAMFSTPVLGSQFLLQDNAGEPAKSSSFEKAGDGSETGELVLVAPAVGLSTTLLNRDHYAEYYEGMPSGPNGELLRRHGDEIEYVRSSLHLREEEQNSTTPYFRALGRSDDTMNIGGKERGEHFAYYRG